MSGQRKTLSNMSSMEDSKIEQVAASDGSENLEAGSSNHERREIFGVPMENLKLGGAVDPVFEAKASVVNAAFQAMGMGRYQWKLFFLCGFGWVTEYGLRNLYSRRQITCGSKG